MRPERWPSLDIFQGFGRKITQRVHALLEMAVAIRKDRTIDRGSSISLALESAPAATIRCRTTPRVSLIWQSQLKPAHRLRGTTERPQLWNNRRDAG
jgi:hypothetical protein